jgi:hypothetical protein
MYNIGGLSEQFVYANDDMIPIGDLDEGSFFQRGVPCLEYSEHPFGFSNSLYRHNLYYGTQMARRLLNLPPTQTYIHTGHNMHPMLRSTWEVLWKSEKEALELSATRFRKRYNINQDVVAQLQILMGEYSPSTRKCIYTEADRPKEIVQTLQHDDTTQLICINDAVTEFEHNRKLILDALQSRLPNKSIYEL